MGLCKIGFAEPNTLWNYLVQYDNTNLRSIIYSQFDNNIMLTWFETNERTNFITHASSVAPGHVGTWQTSHAGHSKETYFNMVKTYYGQSAYDLLIQRYLNNTRTYLDSFGIAEWHPPVGGHGIYGSSRLGIYQSNLNLVTQRFDADVSNGSFEDPENISTTSYEPSYNFYTLQRGNKRYELSNHLGNVLAVISDRKLLVCDGDSFLYNIADVTNATDYSPFGAPLPGRVYNTPTNITSDTTAWIKGWEPSTVSTSYVGNRLKVDVSTLWAGIRRAIKTVPGHNYVFKTTVDLHTAGSVYIFARRMSPNNTSGNIKVLHTNLSGTYEVHFTALDTITYLHVEEGGSYTSGTVTFFLENTIVQDKQLGGKGYRFGFNGKEKDNETYGTGNAYDFGARIYDARLGKMFKVDPYFSVYPGLTPYSGFGGNPITNTDAGGKLIIFVSGYGPLRSSQSSLKYSRHWDVEMRQNAAATMDDYKAMYFTGSSKPFIGLKSLIKKEIKGEYDIEFTSAEMREDAGRAAVTYELAMIIKQQIDEQRITNPNAKINFVAHSMGVAYAAGMVKALLEAKDGEGNNIFSPSDFGESWLFAGYQSNRVDYPIVGTVNQRAHDNDKVAGNEEMRNFTTFRSTPWGNGELSTKAHGSETFLEYFEKTGTRLPETISKNGGTRKESSSKSNDKGGKGGDKTSRPPIRNVRNM